MQIMQVGCNARGEVLTCRCSSARKRLLTPAKQWRVSARPQNRTYSATNSCDVLAAPEATPRRVSDENNLPRRAVLQSALLAAFAPPALAQDIAATDALAQPWTNYVDEVDSFSITVPPGWFSGEGGIDGNTSYSGASGTRRVVAWFPDPNAARDTNVTLVITNVGADFTQMGSFGTAYGFGMNLVGSMDQSYLKRAPARFRPKEPIQEAVLVDANARGRFYEVEYTVFKEPEPKRHLLSYVTIGYNGRYNRLYTLTAQTTEENWEKIRPAIKQMITSFEPPIRT